LGVAGVIGVGPGGRQADAGVMKIPKLMPYLRSSELRAELRRAKQAR
jgi:hypothetical protein